MNIKSTIKLPDDVKFIISRIEQNGGSAYAVGGCVRDALLKKEPYDWDITTDKTPLETERCFSEFNVIETGIKHGTVTIRLNGKNYEVTTFRTEGTYSDCRRPDSVEFVKNLKEDLSRRDFTINAMAYNDKCGIVDLFGGQSDLQKKIIRCVGDAEKRFSEDALRILRALRFSSTLEFKTDIECKNAVFAKYYELKNVSAERIKTELFKMITGKNFKYVCSNYKNVIDDVIYGVKCDLITDVFFEKAFNYEPYKAFAAAVRMSKCENLSKCCANLKLSNFEKNAVKLSALNPDLTDKTSVLRFMSTISDESFDALLDIWDLCGENTKFYRKVKYDVQKNNTCFRLKHLCIDGADVKKYTLYSGRDIGRILNLCLDEVICGNLCNNKESLIEFIKSVNLTR